MIGPRRNRVLHVVVGAGNVNYFANCIRSVNRFEAGEIFAVYNWTAPSDLSAIEAEREKISGSVSTLVVQKNQQDTRTGSLYKANNLGLEFARRGFDYVNFIQADMQMMWWNQKMLARTEEITNSHRARGLETISFSTQLPVRGKRKNLYDGWRWDESAQTFHTSGFVDVCLIPLFDGLNREVSFVGDELRMSNVFSDQRSALFYHPYPFLAPIPFPSTVRDSRTRPSRNVGDPRLEILRINPKFSVSFHADSSHPLAMEEAVFPNGWACTTPYWPSDTTTPTWLRQKFHALRADPLSIFEVRKADGRLSRCPFRRSRPGPLRTLTSLTRLIAEEARKTLTRSRRMGPLGKSLSSGES